MDHILKGLYIKDFFQLVFYMLWKTKLQEITMGLFSRNNNDDTSGELLDSAGLPNSLDLNADYFEPDTPAQIKTNPSPVRKAISYGIEDAISLMRKLPSDNMEVVVSVVKQTLESTQISVDDIITDASDKEERLLNHNSQLEKEIKDLEQEIASRNKQIKELLLDHKETVSVRERLQLANALNEKANPKVHKPQPEPIATAKPDTPETAKNAPQLPH